MSDSVLQSTKQVLGIEPDDPSFDVDVMMHINSAFFTLAQLGIGPASGFMIHDAVATWTDLLGVDESINAVKTLVYLKVRQVFDPPSTPHVLTAMENQITQLEWRLSVHRETTDWVDPSPSPLAEDVYGEPIIIDGGVG